MPRPRKTINVEIGGRIKQLRWEQNLTRQNLADLCGYSQNFIQEVERGRSGLSSESLRAFATALKTSADYLLFGETAEDYAFLFAELNKVPPEKRTRILKIIEEAIACAQ